MAVAQQEFRQIFPQPGWVEHDPTEIWSSQVAVLHEALAQAGVGARDIAAIGITNQRETTLVWDRRTGEPIYNAIVWQDRRTAPICDALQRGGTRGTFAAKTGLVLDAYFSGTKLKWLLDNVPGARERARGRRARVRHRRHVAHLEADRRHGARDRCDERVAHAALRHPRRRVGRRAAARCSTFRARCCRASCASSAACARQATSRRRRVPIAGIAGDQQAALFGQACHAPGLAKNTYGTGCFMLMNTGRNADAPRATTC